MIKIKDETGNVVPGLYRDSVGTIVVKDQDAYDRYMASKSIKLRDQAKISSLEAELRELKALITSIINK